MCLQSEQVSRCFAALNMTRCVLDEKEYTKFVSQRTLRNGVKISFQFEANYFGVSQLSFEANSRAI